jgi:hypothetical protein
VPFSCGGNGSNGLVGVTKIRKFEGLRKKLYRFVVFGHRSLVSERSWNRKDMIIILLIGYCTGILTGNPVGNECFYDRLVPGPGIEGNKAEQVGRIRSGNLTDKIRR